jgi:conjugal transfer pilus assembly protein TrbC
MSDAIMQQAAGRMQANRAHPAALPMPPAADRSSPDPQAIAQRFRLAREQKSAHTESSDLLAFVSFSMPTASLKRLAREASQTGAVLVFRGLKDGSFKATVAAFKPYAQLGARAQINPVAFARFHVESVPRYVLDAGVQSASACPKEKTQCAPEALTLAGDVSLDYALERMAASHDALAARADQYLARLRGQQ